VNSLPKTVTRQRRDCDLNPGSSVPESSTLTTRLPSHPCSKYRLKITYIVNPFTAGSNILAKNGRCLTASVHSFATSVVHV